MKLPPIKFIFSVKDDYKEFELPVKVSTGYKFFYTTADLPKELQELEACPYGDRQYFDTFHELERSVRKLIEEIELSLVEESKSKVILYAVGHESGRKQQIDFRFVVVQKVEMKRKERSGPVTEVKYYEERFHSGRDIGKVLDEFDAFHVFDEKFEEMPWSKEREAWFRDMEARVQRLGEQLKMGFGDKSAILARRIDAGAKFLLNGGSDEPT